VLFADPSGHALNPRTDTVNLKNLLAVAGVPDARLHGAWRTAGTVLLILRIAERAAMEIMGWGILGDGSSLPVPRRPHWG
jgi:hypothetical protein